MGNIADIVRQSVGTVASYKAPAGTKKFTRRANVGYQNITILDGAKVGFKEETGNTWMSFPVALVGPDGNNFAKSSLFFMVPNEVKGETEADRTKSADSNKSRFLSLTKLAETVGFTDYPAYPVYNKETKSYADRLTGKTLTASEADDIKLANRTAILNFAVNLIDSIETTLAAGESTPFVGVSGVGKLSYKDEADTFGTVWGIQTTLPTGQEIAGPVTV